ncbi:MAG: non-homologous end-joining DNA ligase [Archaeoglobaceae archaeon]
MTWFNEKIKPMLAVKGKPFNSPEFIYEIKFDGTRAIAFIDVENERVRLQNRRLLEISYRYPEIDLLSFVKESAILDGEIVVFEGNLPSFSLLQQREHVESSFKASILSKKFPANYFVFDVLYCSSHGWVAKEPLIRRKRILEEISCDAKRVALIDFVDEKGEEFYEKTTKLGIEGVIAKKKTSPYLIGKRSDFWIKIKKRQTLDCVIVGWLEGEGERKGLFGSLILALRSGNSFVHVGQVGTGFDLEFARWFIKKLREIEIKNALFEIETSREVHWCKPEFVCEVEFLELTKDMKLRAPVFLRLRDDKSVDDCTIDSIISLR